VRTVVVALLGFLAGAGATFYLVRSGAGDFAIRRTEAVQDLEHQLRDAETHRDQLGRQLEDVNARAARMEKSFNELERRFHELEGGGDVAPEH
jgi:hypothetical protein